MLLPYFDGLLQTCGPLVVTYPHCPVSPSVAPCLTGVCADRPPSTPSLFVLMKPNTSKHLLFYKRAKKGFVRKARERVREHPGFPTWHTCLSLKRGLLQATSAPGSMIAVSWHRQKRHVDHPRLPLAFDVRASRLSSDARPGMNPERRFTVKASRSAPQGPVVK